MPRKLIHLGLSLVAGVALATPALASTVSLGDAGGYAVFATDSFSYNGGGVINGNVAVGQSINFASPAQINGTLYENTGVTGSNSGVVPTGGTDTVNLSQAISDASTAVTTANGLTVTQTLGALGNGSTINATGTSNVIDVSSIVLTNGQLTINGSASDMFVINDSGAFTFGNSGMTLTGGVTSANILFNVAGGVTITGGGTDETFYGTILAPDSTVSIHDQTLNGEVIGENISDTSGFTVDGPAVVVVPLPASVWSGGLTMFALLGTLVTLRRRTVA